MIKERNGSEMDNGCIVFDVPEEKGIEIIIPVTDFMKASLFMEDKEAEEMIRIIQNKINARID